jgi:Ca2+-binding RTX toxin-like protein
MTIQTTNIDAGDADGFDITALNFDYTVAAGVVITTNQGNAGIDLKSGSGFDFVENNGSISSGGGIDSGSLGNFIWNTSTGTIIGFYGIGDFAGDSEIENDGSIFADEDGLNLQNASGDYLINHGTITANDGAFLFNSSGVKLTNFGTISGNTSALDFTNDTGLSISNYGTLDGNISSSGTTAVTFLNKGAIHGDAEFGDGTFDGRGGTVDGTITGGSGADTIYLGNDGETVNGGLGHDVIYGGTGADTFEFTSDGAANADGIRNFNVANDIIELSHATFTKLTVGQTPVFSIGTGATSASDHLYYNSTGGGLWYDPDGNGPQAAVVIANLGAGLKLTASNFTVVA